MTLKQKANPNTYDSKESYQGLKTRINRRRFIGTSIGVGATGLTLLGCSPSPKYQDSVKIVVVGAGLAGNAVANRLKNQLPNADITIIDKREKHYYQPGYTLLATGVWHNADKVIDDNAKIVPSGINWVKEHVTEFMPDNNQVVTESGQKIGYDYLVIATGLRLGYEKIEGLEYADLGTNGIGSVYASPEIALKTWQQIDKFRNHGGKAIMTLAHTDMKCAGAPLKMTFMVHDRLVEAGTRDKSDIHFFSPGKTIFSVPKVNENVLERWAAFEHPIHTTFEHKLKGIDKSSKTAFFTDNEGNEVAEAYDFIHIVPPMYSVDSVANSVLANEKGWLEVDKYTLQHQKYPNIFGAGDINGTPKGKTAATVKLSAPVVTTNLINVMQGKAPSQKFNGYTSCPMLVSEGEAMLVEFDYENNLTPTVPFVDPLQESYFAWFLEEMMLKPAYMAVAKGKV